LDPDKERNVVKEIEIEYGPAIDADPPNPPKPAHIIILFAGGDH
jgi:hypothetical protein